MEQNDPSRRQYVPQSYTAQQQQPALAPTSGQYGTPGTLERFRQSAYLQEPPTTPTSAVRAASDTQQVYGFGQSGQYGAASTLQSTALQYGQELQSPEAQRQQAQSYQTHGSQVVYGLGQPQTGQSPYDTVSQYRPRTNTASGTLASQFGVPQTSQYYIAGPSSQPHASAPELSQQLPSQYAQPEPYAQAGPSSAPSYAATLMDPTQSGQFPGYVQQAQYPAQPQPTLAQATDRYQNQIRTIFTNANEGSLRDLVNYLIDVSQYLLGNAEQLGLTRDDMNLHDNRIRLWQEFNRAWLVTLQRQLDMTQQILQTNQQPREPQSVMSTQALERLGQELVRLCDVVEKHGLVDYELGVAEEEIVDLLLRCISLLEPPDDRFGESGPQTELPVAGALGGR